MCLEGRCGWKADAGLVYCGKTVKIKKEPDHVEPSRQGNEYRFMLKYNGKLVKGLKREAEGEGDMI